MSVKTPTIPNPAPEPVSPTPPAAEPSTTDPKVPETVPYARFKEVNEGLRAANERLAALETAEAERNQAALLEQGKHSEVIQSLTAQNQDLTKQVQETLLQAAVQRYALEAGAVDPDDVLALVRSKVVVENGVVSGAAEAVAELKAAKPGYFSKAGPGPLPNPGPAAPPPGKMSALLQQMNDANNRGDSQTAMLVSRQIDLLQAAEAKPQPKE